MRISRNWLQSYFTKELPEASALAEVLMLHAFEVEAVYKQGNDWILDVDVLPNRAHDCLCHLGFVQELSALLEYDIKPYSFPELQVDNEYPLEVKGVGTCLRYMACHVRGVSLRPSPEWVKEKLEAMGQRSINALVDLSNLVMFDVGQPLHVFDAQKIDGKIIVRHAKEGEMMTTLSGEELILEASDLVIADQGGILALAGVKGGKKAEVDDSTTEIVIESANFDPLSVRKTARRVKIMTDASKRYENEISSTKAALGMQDMLMMLTNIYPDAAIVSCSDHYLHKETEKEISLDISSVQNLLGLDITEESIKRIFDRLSFTYTCDNGVCVVSVPAERIDLCIQEDLIEEIGRVYGYHNIPSQSVDTYEFTPKVHPLHYASHQVRSFLVKEGYTELMTYSFVNTGDIEVYNPIAGDKKALRSDLDQLLSPALEKNIKYADFLGKDRIAIFEIGRVYTQAGERNLCRFQVHNVNKAAKKKYGSEEDQVKTIIQSLGDFLGIDLAREDLGLLDLDYIAQRIQVPQNYDDVFDLRSYTQDDRFHTISPFPYMTRDISLWIPGDIDAVTIEEAITSLSTSYLKKIFLFDDFEKDGRRSLAFSLIFQSDERTLLDTDLETDMTMIIAMLEEKGAEIR